nr:hypothetical protein [Cytophagaceae bacterium]
MNRYLLILLSFLITKALSQIAPVGIGQWREHLPYNVTNEICHTGDRIYVASNLSGFYYDLNDLSLVPIGKIAGFSDNDVSEIAYSKEYKTVIIGYKSGKIDLTFDNTIVKITDIYRAGFEGTKTINHITAVDDFAYISGDFGLSVLDLKKKEIKESYRNLAPGGISNKVFASAISPDKDSIYLATSRGVMSARLSNQINLLDFSNWYTYPATAGIPVTDVSAVCFNNGILYANVNFKGVYYFNGSSWSLGISLWDRIPRLSSSQGKLTICHYFEIITFTAPSNYSIIADTNLLFPEEAIYDEAGQLWVASSYRGLIKYKDNKVNSIHPYSPWSQSIFHLNYYNNKIIASAGGYSSDMLFTYREAEFYEFENNVWTTTNRRTNSILSNKSDVNFSIYNPVNKKLYFSSYTDGVIVKDENGTINFLNPSNSPLPESVISGKACVTGTAVDAQGNIWFCNKLLAGNKSITILKPDHTLLKHISFPISGEANFILQDDVGNVWIIIRDYLGNKGLLVQKKDGSFVNLTTLLPAEQVLCIEKDKKGSIWIGTTKGIAICYDPNTPTQITTPIFDGFPLLYERSISCIEIDGGNRKWVGSNNGLWLFNDDATEVIHYFDMSNAPMPSSTIIDLEINDITGEIFISTELGTISYRSDATLGAEKHESILVFPNPVKPGFNGLVGIQGLTTDAEVK